MSSRRRAWWWAPFALVVVASPATAAAGPSLAVGRGASLAGDRLAGNCFATVAASPPSYDVRYRFEAVAGDDPDRSQVRIVLDVLVYNRALDEAASTLAPAALALVARGDLLGFFDACGVVYVRSLTRRGRFESTLTYQNAAGRGGRGDPGFDDELETWLRGWGRRGPTPPPGGRDFARRANQARLAVRSTGSGLGKRAGASLVAGDLDSFRAAAQAAFAAMQAPDAGELDELELVPWADHPAVREALHLAPGRAQLLLANSAWLAELLDDAAVDPAAAAPCLEVLLAGDTLASRPHHELEPCRALEGSR